MRVNPFGVISPVRYRTVVLVAGLFLAAIVLTGAAVRLTQAGLGCENWPACSDERFVPEWEFHPWVEFGNRLISGVVAVSVAAAALSAYRRQPRRPDLIRWAWGLVVGVAAQIVLGGVTVRVDLHPALVGVHFLLSMVLLWNVIVLWVRASQTSGPEPGPAVPSSTSLVRNGRVLVGLASAVLLTGTLVTGTGPNSGDARAERLNFDLSSIAQVHSAVVWCFLAVLVILAIRLHRASHGSMTARSAFIVARALIAATILQGAVGYIQFAAGVPPLLVAVHIVGAIVVWCLSILLHLRLSVRRPGDQIVADADPTELIGRTAPPILDKLGT